MLRTAALLVALALGLSGCSALTGRPFVQWTDDKAIQTRVKARLMAVSLKNLGRIHVDVYDGVTYLSGIVESAEAKMRAESAATAVEGVRHVVSNVVARHGGEEVVPSALPAATTARPVPAVLAGVARLEGPRAYDRAGRHIATVYTVAMSELAHTSAQRFAAARPVDHVTVHAMNADAHVPTPHYLLVLWHVPEPKAP
jgi:hypothetical protein